MRRNEEYWARSKETSRTPSLRALPHLVLGTGRSLGHGVIVAATRENEARLLAMVPQNRRIKRGGVARRDSVDYLDVLEELSDFGGARA